MVWPFFALGLVASVLSIRWSELHGGAALYPGDAAVVLATGALLGLLAGALAGVSAVRSRGWPAGLLALGVLGVVAIGSQRIDAMLGGTFVMAVLLPVMRADDVRRDSVLYKVRSRGAWVAVAAAAALGSAAMLFGLRLTNAGHPPPGACVPRPELDPLAATLGLGGVACLAVLLSQDILAGRAVRALARRDLVPRAPDGYAGSTFDFVDLGAGDAELEAAAPEAYRAQRLPDVIVRGDLEAARLAIARMVRSRAIILAACFAANVAAIAILD